MNRKRNLAILLLAAWAGAATAAQRLSLLSDLGVRGAYRHCEYSNGKVYGMNASQSCPSSIAEPADDGRGMASFQSESHEGSNELCVYRVSGQDRTLRVDTQAQCPLNHEF